MMNKRTITVEATEGTNMDVDISPDGKTLVFTLIGEVFTVPVQGGKARQLTRGLAINSKPVCSPDGKMIAYTSDVTGRPKIHVMDYLGTPIFFNRTENINSITEEIFWKSNSDSVVRYPYDIIVENVVYNFAKDLDPKSSSYNGANNPRWSSDGQWATFITGADPNATYLDSLMVIDLNTRERRLLARLNSKNGNYLTAQHYCFSPDQKSIYIGYSGKIHKIRLKDGFNEIIPFDAKVEVDMYKLNKNRHRISFNPISLKHIRDIQLRPDGQQLVFSALNKIYVQDLPDGKPKVLIEQSFGQFQPRYSPDGKWIAYVSWQDSIQGHVWRVLSSGEMPQQLTKIGSNYQNPAWSNSGEKIIYVRNEKGLRYKRFNMGTVQVISLKDNSFLDLPEKGQIQGVVGFSKDDNTVYYTGKIDNGDMQLMSAQIDNSRVTQLSRGLFPMVGMGNELNSVQPSISTGTVLFNRGESLYLAIPKPGWPVVLVQEGESLENDIIRFSRMGVDPHWEDEGKTIAWNYSNKYYRIEAAKIIDAARNLKPQNGQSFKDVIINPDRVIRVELFVEQLYGKDVLALTNTRIITMGAQGVIENGCILIKNGRIAKVGSSAGLVIPKDAVVISLKGKTILPGLIDLHDHIGVSSKIFGTQISNYQLALAFGTTTSRNPSGAYVGFGYQEMLNTGRWVGPRLYQVGNAVKDWYGLTSQSEADSTAKSRSEMGGIAIKQYYLPNRLKRQLLGIAATKYKLNLTNEEAHPIEVLGMLKDGSFGVEHIKYWQENYKDVLDFFVKSGVVWTPTLLASPFQAPIRFYFANNYPIDAKRNPMAAMWLDSICDIYSMGKNYEVEIKKYPLHIEKFKEGANFFSKMVEAGGLVGVGGHGEIPGLGMHYEMWALHMAGMSNVKVLEAATLTGAKALGLERELGSIARGKIADLLILDKNPLDDIHNTNTIRYIMKAGVLFDQKNLKVIDSRLINK